jgi:hypothetical protein
VSVPYLGAVSKDAGLVGKAGMANFDARGNVDLDRGTMAFFFKMPKAPACIPCRLPTRRLRNSQRRKSPPVIRSRSHRMQSAARTIWPAWVGSMRG